MELPIKVDGAKHDAIGSEFSKQKISNPFSTISCTDVPCEICNCTRLHWAKVGEFDAYHCPGQCHTKFLQDEKDAQHPILMALVKNLQEKRDEDQKKMEEEKKKMDEDKKMLTEELGKLVKENEELRTALQSHKSGTPIPETGAEQSGTGDGLKTTDWICLN